MWEFIESAGWGIYPVLAFGLAGCGVAIRELMEHRPGRVVTVVWLMALTMMAGVLGTVTGVQTSARWIHDASEKWIFLLGMQESLNCTVAAGVLVMLAMLTLLVSHLRRGTAMAAATP